MGGACGLWLLAFYRSFPFPTSSFSLAFSPILLFLVPCPSFLLPRVPRAGGRRPAQTPPRKRGGGHPTRGRAGSWGLPPQKPARALPRPGPHAPISEEPLGGVGGKSAKRSWSFRRRVFAVVSGADGGEEAGRRPSFYGVVLLLPGGHRSEPGVVQG